jgi:hypothetical protein
MNVPKTVAESYLALTRDGLPDPSISTLIDRAGVSQEEFATRFTGLEGVSLLALEEMLWMLQGSNMPRRLDEGNLGPDAARAICDDIVARVVDAWEPVTVGIRNHRSAVQLAIGEAIQRRAVAYFAAYPGFRPMDQAYLASAARYVGHGLAAIVSAWVAGEIEADSAIVAGHLSRSLPAWLTDPKSTTTASGAIQ